MARLAQIILALTCLALTGAEADTVLVLPFFNLSKSASLDWIGESIAETVRESLLAWQAELALAPKAAPSEEEFRKARPPLRVDAIESYVRGLLAVSTEQKHHFFTQAVRLDSRFPQPCFQLGRLHAGKKDYRV